MSIFTNIATKFAARSDAAAADQALAAEVAAGIGYADTSDKPLMRATAPLLGPRVMVAHFQSAEPVTPRRRDNPRHLAVARPTVALPPPPPRSALAWMDTKTA